MGKHLFTRIFRIKFKGEPKLDFKNLAIVLVFNIITQAIPIGLAIYFGIGVAIRRNKIII